MVDMVELFSFVSAGGDVASVAILVYLIKLDRRVLTLELLRDV
jgi:hypothetical protein